MDELALLERVRADVEIDPTALLRARRRLLRHAVAPAVRRRRTARRVVVAAAVAAAVAALAVLVLPGPQGAEPAAAAVLSRAARVAAAEQEPGPGEWLYVRHETTRAPGNVETSYVQEHWVPGDPGAAEIILDEDDRWTSPVERPSIYADTDISVDDLYAWLRRDNGDLRGDDAAFERAAEVLSDSGVPAAFKSRLLDAIVLIDGVHVVASGARFHGHDAVVVGREEGDFETRFAFDSETGILLGFEGVGEPSSMDYSTLVTSRVVDTLPRRAAP
jgi:hypothetical protein